MKQAYFAGGCFWCITPFFKMKKGVIKVTSGYSGGDEVNPSYFDVKSQKTGHRETIKVDYDETLVKYEELLEIFLANVDVYDGEGQFIDRGHSYTLAVYYLDEIEKEIVIERLKKYPKETYVSIERFKTFYKASEEHQDFYLKNPEAFEKEMKESGRKK